MSMGFDSGVILYFRLYLLIYDLASVSRFSTRYTKKNSQHETNDFPKS